MSKHLDLAILRQLIMRMHNGLASRKISKELHLNRKTVDKYFKILQSVRDKLPSLLELSDEQLVKWVYASKTVQPSDVNDKKKLLSDQAPYYAKELTRPGVTLKLLWQEYKGDQKKEDVYGYSSFCRILRVGLKATKTSYHKHYSPGDVLMIDFAGDKVFYVDKTTGECIDCVVYVGVLGYSNYTYVEVLPCAKLPYLIEALNNNLNFIGGVPVAVLTDNMAQLVTKANRYEPKITSAAIAWANHNKTAIQTCTVASPREKSPVEGHVKITYQRLYAPLRNVTFYSLQELREAFAKKLSEHNLQNFQGRTYSRFDQFSTEELKMLQPLPAVPFKMQYFAQVKVQKNYHVMLGEDKHFYSVPAQYVDQAVQIIYTTDTVEIYHEMVRIATHQRVVTAYGYSTVKEHMPKHDLHYDQAYGYKKQDFLNMAEKIGPHTKTYIELMLNSRVHEQHAYVGCLGTLRLGKEESYGPLRLERACRIGIQLQHYSYKTIAGLLKTGVDKRDDDDEDTDNEQHNNLRGPDAF